MTELTQSNRKDSIMERRIEPTDGLEIFANQSGTISIKQDTALGEENLVIIQPAHVDLIIKWLKEVAEEIEDNNNN